MGAHHGRMADQGRVIIEFYRVGAYVKVSAIDPATFTEVSIVGAPDFGEEALARVAIRKLNYVLERRGKKPHPPHDRRA